MSEHARMGNTLPVFGSWTQRLCVPLAIAVLGSACVKHLPPAPVQPTKIEVAKSELIDAITKLAAQTRLNVIFFNSGLLAYEPTLFSLDDQGRTGLVGFIQGTGPTGSTALAPAMRAAFLMNAQRVVLLSDGLGNVGGNAFAVLRDAREAMRGGVRIDTIGLGQGQDADLLSTLAGESGGLYQRL